MAAPHAAGVGALLYSAGVRDPDTAEQMLEQSAQDLGDAHRFGSGLISAPAALSLASQGTGVARAGLAVALSFLLLLGLRRRKSLGVSAGASTGWAVAAAGGLGALPWFWIPVVGGSLGTYFSLGALGSGAFALGPWGALGLLSAVPMFTAVALGLHAKRLRSLIVGFGVGSAAFLMVEALLPTLRVALLPELLVGPWLLVNALACLGLAALVARHDRA
jgi:hypothetical protein